MPASADRDEIITKAQAKVQTAIKKQEEGGNDDYEGTQALKIAQSTVHSLQVSALSHLHLINSKITLGLPQPIGFHLGSVW